MNVRVAMENLRFLIIGFICMLTLSTVVVQWVLRWEKAEKFSPCKYQGTMVEKSRFNIINEKEMQEMNECKGDRGELDVPNNRVYLYAYIIHCRGPMGFAVGESIKVRSL